MTANVSNWVGEVTTTTGQGSIALGGPIEGHTTFSNMPDGPIWYAVVDGANREAGLGTLTGGSVIVRSTVYATLVNGLYSDNGAAAIDLSGAAEVYSTFNKAAFDEFNLVVNEAVRITGDQGIDGEKIFAIAMLQTAPQSADPNSLTKTETFTALEQAVSNLDQAVVDLNQVVIDNDAKAVQIAGSTMTGSLVLHANAEQPLEPAAYGQIVKPLTADLNVTVGAGGDFDDLQAALNDARLYYSNSQEFFYNITCVSGYILDTPVVVLGGALPHVVVLLTDATLLVDMTAINATGVSNAIQLIGCVGIPNFNLCPFDVATPDTLAGASIIKITRCTFVIRATMTDTVGTALIGLIISSSIGTLGLLNLSVSGEALSITDASSVDSTGTQIYHSTGGVALRIQKLTSAFFSLLAVSTDAATSNAFVLDEATVVIAGASSFNAVGGRGITVRDCSQLSWQNALTITSATGVGFEALEGSRVVGTASGDLIISAGNECIKIDHSELVLDGAMTLDLSVSASGAAVSIAYSECKVNVSAITMNMNNGVGSGFLCSNSTGVFGASNVAAWTASNMDGYMAEALVSTMTIKNFNTSGNGGGNTYHTKVSNSTVRFVSCGFTSNSTQIVDVSKASHMYFDSCTMTGKTLTVSNSSANLAQVAVTVGSAPTYSPAKNVISSNGSLILAT